MIIKGKRLKGPRLYHHIYNRGNDRHPIFKRVADYQMYLKLLSSYNKKFTIDVIAYALMEWHMHLFIFDRNAKISEFIEDLHGHYARIYNIVYQRVGHVFGSRFHNKIVDANNYGLWLSRYIHRQAVEAGLVDNPEEYKWTSYLHYIGKKDDSFIKNEIIIEQFGDTIKEQKIAYKSFVLSQDDGPINWKQAQLNPQLVIGSKSFIKKIAKKLNIPNLITPDIDDALTQIYLQYNVTLDDLRSPQSRSMRALRRHIIYQLSTKYGLGTKKIAQLLEVSIGLVSMIRNSKYSHSHKKNTI
jgi:putative transposase